MEMRKSRGRGDGRERIKLNFYTFSGRYQWVLWMETSRRRPNRTSPGVGEMRSGRSDSEGGLSMEGAVGERQKRTRCPGVNM